jgi:hypothetical protein
MSSPVFLKEGMCYKEIGPDGKYLGKYISTNSLSQYGNGISHYVHEFENGSIYIDKTQSTTINNTNAKNISHVKNTNTFLRYLSTSGMELPISVSNQVEHTDCKEPIPEAKPKKFFGFFGGVRNKRRTRKNRKTRRKN